MNNVKCATGTILNIKPSDTSEGYKTQPQIGAQIQAQQPQTTITKSVPITTTHVPIKQEPSIITKAREREEILRSSINWLRNNIFKEESTIRRLKTASPSRLLRIARRRELLNENLAELRHMNLLDRPAETVLFILNNNSNGVLTDDLRSVLRGEDIIWSRQVLVREKRITATAKGSGYILKPITTQTKQAA